MIMQLVLFLFYMRGEDQAEADQVTDSETGIVYFTIGVQAIWVLQKF